VHSGQGQKVKSREKIILCLVGYALVFSMKYFSLSDVSSMKLLLRKFVGCMFVLCTHDVMKQKSIVLKFQTGELYVALANIEDWCMVTVTAVINLPVNIVNKIQTGLQENFLYNY
jgi:hypothetical protein